MNKKCRHFNTFFCLNSREKESWKTMLPYAGTNGETVCSRHYVCWKIKISAYCYRQQIVFASFYSKIHEVKDLGKKCSK